MNFESDDESIITSDDTDDDCPDFDNVSESLAEQQCYIVYMSCLKELLMRCPTCGDKLHKDDIVFQIIGSALSVKITCTSGHFITWNSQPKIGKNFLGNVALTSATILTGNTYTTLSEISDSMNMRIIRKSQFYDMQHSYVQPTVDQAYNIQQEMVKCHISNSGMCVLIGDGRYD